MKQLAGGRPGRAPEIQYFNWDQMTWDIQAALSELVADLDSTSGEGTNFGAQWAFVPVLETQLHDPNAADLALSTAGYDEPDELNRASRHWANAMLADERGNAALAAQEWEQAVAAYSNPLLSIVAANLPCFAARAFERAGRHADADRALDVVGKRRFVDCFRFRADILDARGNWAAAQRPTLMRSRSHQIYLGGTTLGASRSRSTGISTVRPRSSRTPIRRPALGRSAQSLG